MVFHSRPNANAQIKEGNCIMMRPMNDSETELALICDECEDIATHCNAETTDYPLILCATHAMAYSMIYGGFVRMSLEDHPVSVDMMATTVCSQEHSDPSRRRAL